MKDPRLYLFITLLVAFVCGSGDDGYANPYLAKPGEPVVKVRIGTCAVTGGFIHLYAALDNRLFDMLGMDAVLIVVRGGNVAMAALAADEINFLYCNADANIVRIGTGADGKLVASPLILTSCSRARTSGGRPISRARVSASHVRGISLFVWQRSS